MSPAQATQSLLAAQHCRQGGRGRGGRPAIARTSSDSVCRLLDGAFKASPSGPSAVLDKGLEKPLPSVCQLASLSLPLWSSPRRVSPQPVLDPRGEATPASHAGRGVRVMGSVRVFSVHTWVSLAGSCSSPRPDTLAPHLKTTPDLEGGAERRTTSSPTPPGPCHGASSLKGEAGLPSGCSEPRGPPALEECP